jgi:WhiB family transcriptional regulator, redox-sensing transcriptional regulator
MRAEKEFIALAEGIQKHGAPVCQQTDPELWFPESGGENFQYRTAKKFCQRCPVKAECLALALANNEQYGIWGGLTTKDRQRLIRKA